MHAVSTVLCEFRLLWRAAAGVCLLSLLIGCSSGGAGEVTVSRPVPNPYLSSPVYGITHFDSSQSDSTPYGPPPGIFTVDPSAQPISYGGPMNITTLASTDQDYMWAIGTDRVSYVYRGAGNWQVVATYNALARASNNLLPAVPDASLRLFGEASAVGMNTATMEAQLQTYFGDNYAYRYGNGAYVLVDRDNVLYANYLNTLYAFTLVDKNNPSAGIRILHVIDNAVAVLQAGYPAPPAGTRIVGLSMTYDGRLIVAFSNGVAVIRREFSLDERVFYRLPDTESLSNSIAVDEQNGIYLASSPLSPGISSIMRKLVWTGTTLSDRESDGAWASPYDNSAPEKPPLIKFDFGTGSTPTLMGFGADADKLVVITDGAKQMKLLAFWRDRIPDGFVQRPGTASRRIAGQIRATCGFARLPEWIQSEQSVVVSGYGAFVVNNIPETYSPELQSARKYVQVALMGPAYPTPYGVERFQWDPQTHAWRSVWARADVSSTSMIPVHSQKGSMAVINGYRPQYGWEVLGLDWNTGRTVHQTVFGQRNYGNGAYAILQYLENGDLLFNSIVGPFRLHYGD